MRRLLSMLISASLIGCGQPGQTGYVEYYNQIAPSTPPKTKEVKIFSYKNADIKNLYSDFFQNFLVIGRTAFTGPLSDPKKASDFAKSVGSDVLVTNSKFKETRTSQTTTTMPTVSTTHFSGGLSGTATTYGTKTKTEPLSVDRYTQSALYLSNVNDVIPLWERKKEYYKDTGSHKYEGVWSNENYQLKIFSSGEGLASYILDVRSDNRHDWEKNDIKFLFNKEAGVGIYLMGDKRPELAEFAVNKFGHLEVKISGTGDKFSFSREE